MKILFISSTDDSLGSAKSLLELVEQLKKKSIEMIVVNPYKNGLNDKLDELGIENYSVGYRLNICQKNVSGLKYFLKFSAKYLWYIAAQVVAKRRIEKKINFSKIDIIHTNNSVMDIGAYFAKKYNKKHVWHLREFGKEDFNFVYFRKNIAKYISDNCTKAVAITNIVKDAWIDKGVDPKKVRVITHGVSNSKFLNIERKIDKEKVKFIFLGNIVPAKGQFGFIKALSKLSEEEKKKIELHLYGSITDNYNAELTDYIQKEQLEETVFFKGYCNDVSKILPHYDIGIVNSRFEAMGRVSVEYMMAGLCVFASKRGGNIELLKNGEVGVLYEYENEEEIITAIKDAIKDKKKYEQLGEKAREYALKELSIENNASKFVELYKECLDE